MAAAGAGAEQAPGGEPLSLLEVLRRSTAWLVGRGVESPRLEAELLVAHALGLRRLDLYLRFDAPVDEAARARIRTLLRRRGGGEPVAYLTGEREFWSLAFHVGPGVLIPRPETEHLVDVALEALRPLSTPCFADVGTGSGCVAVALLVALPAARAHATDVSGAAIEIARRNAERHGVAARLTLHEGSLLGPLRGGGDWGQLDAVLSNPPYVVRGDPALAPEVAAHEPEQALYVPGGDPLEVALALAEEAREAVRAGGLLALEVGAGSAPAACEALGRMGWTDVAARRDLARIERVVLARRPSRERAPNEGGADAPPAP